MKRILMSCLFLGTICGLALSQSVHGVIRANAGGEPIDPLLYGINTARWDESLFPGPTADLLLSADRDAIAKVRTAGITLLKYPGGNDADAYIWNDPANNATEMDTDEYIAFCRQVGAEPFITINFNASPELAASWVRYCNVERGYDVTLWEVGDEQWGTWAKGHAPPEVYARKYKAFVDAMRRVDPDIKVATNVPLGPHPENWTTRVLQEAADYVDILTFTFFPQRWGEENDDTLLATVQQFDKLYRDLYAEVVSVLGEDRAKDILFVNVGYNSVNHSPGPQTLELVNAIWTADMMGTMMDRGVDIGCFWALHNAFPPRKGDYGILSSEGSSTPSFTYYAFPMFSNHMRGVALPVSVDDAAISLYAALDDETMSLVLINRDKSEGRDMSLSFEGFAPGGVTEARVLDASRRYAAFEDAAVAGGALTIRIPPFAVVVIDVLAEGSATPPKNLAQGAVATASSFSVIGPHFGPEKAVDGLTYTRWNSAAWTKSGGREEQWFRLDWPDPQNVSTVQVQWGSTRAVSYALEVSRDGASWETVATVPDGKGDVDMLKVGRSGIRAVRIKGTQGSPGISAYSIREIGIY